MLATEWYLTRAPISEEESDPPPSLSRSSALLAEGKSRVPSCIETHGRRAWERAIAARFSTPSIKNAPPDVASRAFYKLREISLTCSLERAKRSFHLAEAPGGFVQATSQCCQPDWEWRAVSIEGEGLLSPASHLLPSDKGYFLEGLPKRSDLLEEECRNCIVVKMEKEGKKFDLVTADGSIDMDHDRLEEEHLPLLYAQTNLAFRLLERGGTFVCKFFEGSYYDTTLWLGEITNRFHSSSILKPKWSRATNSERYVVAKGFEGDQTELRKTGRLGQHWHSETRRVLDRICDDQCAALHEVIEGISRKRPNTTYG